MVLSFLLWAKCIVLLLQFFWKKVYSGLIEIITIDIQWSVHCKVTQCIRALQWKILHNNALKKRAMQDARWAWPLGEASHYTHQYNYYTHYTHIIPTTPPVLSPKYSLPSLFIAIRLLNAVLSSFFIILTRQLVAPPFNRVLSLMQCYLWVRCAMMRMERIAQVLRSCKGVSAAELMSGRRMGRDVVEQVAPGDVWWQLTL